MPQPRGRASRFLATIGLAGLLSSAAVVAQVVPNDCHEPQACVELALEARARGAYESFHDLAWRAVQTGRPNDPDLMYLLARAQALSGRRRDALVMLRRLAEAGVATNAATEEDLRLVRELPQWAYVAGLSTRALAPPSAPAAVERPPATAVKPAARAAVERPPATAVKPAAPVAVERPPAAAAKPAAPAAVEGRPASVAKPVVPAVVEKPSAAAAKPVAPAIVTPPTTTSAAPAPTAVRSALRVERASVDEAARFSTRPFVPGGFAYDAVSQRLLFGDVTGRRLFVVGAGSDRTVDLVRADGADFDDVTAVAVDAKRGELWVASSAADGSGGAVHRLQLISGRALTKFAVPGQGPTRLSDVAVTGDGTVLILDAATPRVFVRRPGSTAVALLMPLTGSNPVSLTASEDGRSVYVAHPEGITHIGVASRRARPLGSTKGITTTGFSFIRWHRDGLVGGQLQPDGSQGLVRLRLDRDQSAVSQATLIEDPASSEGAVSATISGDDLYYVVDERSGNQTAESPLADVRVNRVKLRER